MFKSLLKLSAATFCLWAVVTSQGFATTSFSETWCYEQRDLCEAPVEEGGNGGTLHLDDCEADPDHPEYLYCTSTCEMPSGNPFFSHCTETQ
jgi:hypothetical protein